MKNDTRFEIRSATASDISTLVIQRHLMLEEISHRKPSELRKTDLLYRKWLIEMFRKRRVSCFLALNKLGRPVGGGCVWLRDSPPSPRNGYRLKTPYLMSMYTIPKYRGLGIATMIVKSAISWSSSLGFPRLTLHASDDGRRVYKKLGFERSWEMRLELDAKSKRR